jgi:hypothetical protein
METWKELDIEIEQEIARSYIQADMLRAQLTVLIVKRMVTYETQVDEIQQALAIRYGIEYDPSDISDELICMRWEEYQANKHVLEPEDYFEGY